MKQYVKADAQLGNTIRSLRIDCGFGVDELVKHLQLEGYNITRQCLYKIESGNHHVTVEFLQLLHRVFDVPYERFFEPEEESE